MTDHSPHRLYCPKCDKTVEIPYATEISGRSCPTDKCGNQAANMWPSKFMYDRDVALKAAQEKAAQPATQQEQQFDIRTLVDEPEEKPSIFSKIKDVVDAVTGNDEVDA